MKQPPGYSDNSNQVLRLKKAIYGLKQAGREWNTKIDGFLKNLGFNPCDNEPCLYRGNKKNLSLILIYVDDILIACKSKEDMIEIKNAIKNEFECVDKGELRLFLGMEIERDGELGSIKLGSSQYIKKLLLRKNFLNCKNATTPLNAGFQVVCENNHCQQVDPNLYQSTIGELNWLALTTRPDILHSISKLAQRNNNPHVEHMTAIKHVLRYLSTTQDMKLHYEKTGSGLIGYADADWGRDKIDRKSYSGYVFVLAGGSVSWQSKKQQSVALSSTEAEYMALTNACTEALSLRQIIIEMGCGDKNTPTTVYGDNLSAQQLAKNKVYHARTKHIDIRFHFIRQVVKSGEVELKYIPTNNMVADILTKNLAKNKHNEMLKMLNLK